MTTYAVQYFDHSGLLRESFSPGADPHAAIANVVACEPRLLRVVSCKPRPRGEAK